jgi:hypothetical protein
MLGIQSGVYVTEKEIKAYGCDGYMKQALEGE